MSIKQNYLDQFLGIILGKDFDEKKLLSNLSREPAWDESLRYSFTQIIGINSLTYEDINSLIKPWYRVNLLAALYEK